MTQKWIANDRHHGTQHPEGDWVYFAIEQVGAIGSLAGYVSPAEFKRLARRFGVSPKVSPTVSPAFAVAEKSVDQP